MRKLSEDICVTLKAMWRTLVYDSGRTDHAAALLGTSISRISEYGSRDHMDRFPRIDQIVHLELDSGALVFTKYLADLHGMELRKRDAGKEIGINAHFASIVKEVSELQTRMAAAMADGTISEAERAELIKECREAIDALQALLLELLNKGLKVVGK